MKVFIVDDQEAVAAIISRIAAQGGWQAFHSSSVDGLEQILRENQIDVLMIDYLIDPTSETHTGLSVTEQLRQTGLSLPVILFSGATQMIDPERARRAGVTRILEKPLSIRELRTSLNEAQKQIPTRSSESEKT